MFDETNASPAWAETKKPIHRTNHIFLVVINQNYYWFWPFGASSTHVHSTMVRTLELFSLSCFVGINGFAILWMCGLVEPEGQWILWKCCYNSGVLHPSSKRNSRKCVWLISHPEAVITSLWYAKNPTPWVICVTCRCVQSICEFDLHIFDWLSPGVVIRWLRCSILSALTLIRWRRVRLLISNESTLRLPFSHADVKFMNTSLVHI